MNAREANWKAMWREDKWERKANGMPPMTWKKFKAWMEGMEKRRAKSGHLHSNDDR